MKSFFEKKTVMHKIIIAIVIVLLFNFITPTISSASIGGILFEPIKDLLLVIADGIIMLSQNFIFGLDVSFLTIYHKDSGASVAAGILTGLLVVVALVAAPFTGGLSLGIIIAGAAAGYAVGKIVAESIPPTFKLPIFMLTPEGMFGNTIPFLDVNFFETAEAKNTVDGYEDENGEWVEGPFVKTTTTTGEVVYQKSSALVLRPVISKWYYALRNFAIIALLCILVYTAIRIIISSSAEDKAKYKQRLMDWTIAMCLLFFMHYIMAFAMTLTESITEAVNSMNKPYYLLIGTSNDKLDEYKYGDGAGEESQGQMVFDIEGSEMATQLHNNGVIVDNTDESGGYMFLWPTNLMGKARIELQLEPTDITEDDVEMRQFGYTVVYLVLVIYTMLFLFRYLKRLLMLAFLTIIAPLMAMTYPLDKMRDGSAQGFNMWLKEYLYNLLIQPVHLVLYTVLIGSAIDLVQDNLLYAIVALGFLLEAEKLLRKFFGFDNASTVAGGSALGGALAMQGFNVATRFLSKRGKDGKSRNGNKNVEAGKQRALTRGKDKGKDINALYASGADALETGTSRTQALESGNESGNTRGSIDGQALQQNVQASASQLQAGARQQQRNATPSISSTSASIPSTTSSSKPTLRNRVGMAASHYVPKAGRGLARLMTQTVPKLAIKGTLAGTGAMIGLSAGLASDNFGDVGKWTAAGVTGGWLAGEGASNLMEGAESNLQNMSSEFYQATHTHGQIEERQNRMLDEQWRKDDDVIQKYAEQFACSRKEAQDVYMKEAEKFREYGITDDSLIIKAMKAEDTDFGKERNSNQRILLAQLASQVENSKDVDQVRKRLKIRNFSSDNAKKYAEQIRKMKGLI